MLLMKISGSRMKAITPRMGRESRENCSLSSSSALISCSKVGARPCFFQFCSALYADLSDARSSKSPNTTMATVMIPYSRIFRERSPSTYSKMLFSSFQTFCCATVPKVVSLSRLYKPDWIVNSTTPASAAKNSVPFTNCRLIRLPRPQMNADSHTHTDPF